MSGRPSRDAKRRAISQLFGNSDEECDEHSSSDSNSQHAENHTLPDSSDSSESEDGEEDDANPFRWRKHLSTISRTVPADSFSEPPDDDSPMTPLDYFHLFISQSMLQKLADETNRYSVEKSGRSIQVTSAEMGQFIGILLVMGIVKLPTYRLYWSSSYRIAPVADTMGLNRFETIKRYFHVTNNALQLPRDNPDSDPLFKIRPLLEHVRNNCHRIEPEVRQCVDESMIKYKGRSHFRRYVPKKPIRWSFKVITCGISGIVYDFLIDGDNFERPSDSILDTQEILSQNCVILYLKESFIYTQTGFILLCR